MDIEKPAMMSEEEKDQLSLNQQNQKMNEYDFWEDQTAQGLKEALAKMRAKGKIK